MGSQHHDHLASLLVLAQQGDRLSYDKFLREVSELLRCYLKKRMNSHESVEDVLQDTLLAIHQARHSYLRDRPISPWLYAICEHRMSDYFRKVKRQVRADSALDFIAPRTDSPLNNEAGRASGVIDALKKIPARQRGIIELLKFQDLSVHEVATRTGMSESAVKVTASRGYQAIRNLLGRKKP